MTSTDPGIRGGLVALLGFVALNAFGGGGYGLWGAEGVPTEWLQGSPFHDYFIPSLILFVGVGGSCALATVAVLRRFRLARPIALFAGAVLLGWIAVQVAIIGYVSWLQPAMVIAGLLIIALAMRGLDRAPAKLSHPPERSSSELDAESGVRP